MIKQIITPHKDFNIQREVEFISIVCTNTAIEFRCKVHYEDNKIPSKEVVLTADNSVIVDAQGQFYVPQYNTVQVEGEYIDEVSGNVVTGLIDTQVLIEEPTFGQFDFLLNLKGFSILELINFEIQRADELNRFD